jgi:hypothetical protein
MMKLSDRVAKLEARCGRRQKQGVVMRHVIEGATQAERQAKAHALAAAHDPRTFHIFRMVVDPARV